MVDVAGRLSSTISPLSGALRGGRAAVQSHSASRNGKPQPDATRLTVARLGGAIERLEQAVEFIIRHTCAVVAHAVIGVRLTLITNPSFA